MIDLLAKLPFWLNGTQARRTAQAAAAWWARVETWLGEAAAQASIATCSEAALAAHARDRNLERLPGEPLALWRGRVQHALRTVIEAGSRAGLEFLLETYGVVGAAVLERDPGSDWDVIEIRLSPQSLNGADSLVLDRIFHKWGRACRRYVIAHIDRAPGYHASTFTDELQHVEVAA